MIKFGLKKSFTSNNDLNNIISCFKNSYDLKLICRKSKKRFRYKLNHKIRPIKVSDIKEKNQCPHDINFSI